MNDYRFDNPVSESSHKKFPCYVIILPNNLWFMTWGRTIRPYLSQFHCIIIAHTRYAFPMLIDNGLYYKINHIWSFLLPQGGLNGTKRYIEDHDLFLYEDIDGASRK